jgi:hypothetical protein
MLTAPALSQMVAGSWAMYMNGLVDGAQLRPAAFGARLVQRAVSLLAK